MKTILFLLASLVFAQPHSSFAQAPKEGAKEAPKDPPEKAAVITNGRAYEAAYARGDVKALSEFFSDDADYLTDDGRSFRGREAIEGAIRTGLEANRGGKLAIAVETVQVLSPETLLEKGATTVTFKSGDVSQAIYTAIHVKRDGKWKIHQLIETPVPALTPQDHLSQLGWLVGQWEETDKTNDLSIQSQYQWARGGNFLTRNITVKKGGNAVLEGWQVIGWDPLTERLRTWTFDGEGGFAEGSFTRDGDRWLHREAGMTPDGNRTSADSTFIKVNADRFTWESINRTLNGDPQPSIGRIEINRVKGN